MSLMTTETAASSSGTSVLAKPGQYLTFQLGLRTYGVAVKSVREINPMTDITPVPKTAHFVAGVMNLRGKIIPVIDLRLKLSLEATGHTRSTCIVVVESEEDSQGNHFMGVIVDAVNSVIELQSAQIEPPPVLGETARLKFVVGMGKVESQVIILLDVAATLSAQELEAAQSLAA
jgi:purine-binding chemotaxis protein CheW